MGLDRKAGVKCQAGLKERLTSIPKESLLKKITESSCLTLFSSKRLSWITWPKIDLKLLPFAHQIL